jgi:hypothetical protein
MVIAAILLTVDRVLLLMERRGWINYRHRGLSRPGTAYHALLLESIFNPAAKNIVEVKYAQEQEHDDSGEPPGPPRGDARWQDHSTAGAETDPEEIEGM